MTTTTAAADAARLAATVAHAADLIANVESAHGFAPHMNCEEADALADLFAAAGLTAAAVNVIAMHATGDDDPDDTHRHIYEAHMAASVVDGPVGMRRAADYLAQRAAPTPAPLAQLRTVDEAAWRDLFAYAAGENAHAGTDPETQARAAERLDAPDLAARIRTEGLTPWWMGERWPDLSGRPCARPTPTGPCDRSGGHPGDCASATDAPR